MRSDKKEQFQEWLQKKGMVELDIDERWEEFDKWLKLMDMTPGKAERKEQFYTWNYKLQMKDIKAFDHLTHKQIYDDHLDYCRKEGFISSDGLFELLHFREVAYDLFLLLDHDNDNKLLSKTLIKENKKDKLVSLGLEEDFWQLLRDQQCKPKQEFEEWIEENQIKYQVQMNFHQFQKMLWHGMALYSIDIESIH